MTANQVPNPQRGTASTHPTAEQCSERESSVATGELLDLLGDEYTRAVLEAVAETGRSGREVAEVTDVSRPTAFRRLNRLEAAGLVRTEMVVETDGHHYKEYQSVLERASFELGKDGLSADVELEAQDSGGRRVPTGGVIADD